jgi:5-methylcytosine-specific restriction endonuclease McrA
LAGRVAFTHKLLYNVVGGIDMFDNISYQKKHYQENKAAYKEAAKRRASEMRVWIQGYKAERGCQKCGYNKCSAALDFHHVDPNDKEFPIAKMWSYGWGKDRVSRELEKCIVLCANCHRELHAPVV